MQLVTSKHWLVVSGRVDGRCSLGAEVRQGLVKVNKKTEGARCSAYAREYPKHASGRRGPEPAKAAVAEEAHTAPSAGRPLQPAVLAALLAAGSLAISTKGQSRQFRPHTMDDHTASGEIKQAAPAALKAMAQYFPEAVEQHSYVRAVAKSVFSFGFTNDNCIALVNTCRDEVCRPIYNNIDQQFGLAFDICGLGGLVNCGKTGFKAAMSHSPEFGEDEKRERYIFFAFPHISVGETGEVGSLLRRGRGKPSNACGALIAITNNLQSPAQDDAEDAEFFLLKKKVQKELSEGQGLGNASLVDVTKAALEVITGDLENLVNKTVDPVKADYAVFTGIQIHSGNQIPGEPFQKERTVDYIAPHRMYAVIRGKRHELQLETDPAAGVKGHE